MWKRRGEVWPSQSGPKPSLSDLPFSPGKGIRIHIQARQKGSVDHGADGAAKALYHQRRDLLPALLTDAWTAPTGFTCACKRKTWLTGTFAGGWQWCGGLQTTGLLQGDTQRQTVCWGRHGQTSNSWLRLLLPLGYPPSMPWSLQWQAL